MENITTNYRQKQQALEHFGNLLPSSQQWFSPKEMASIIGKTDQYVRNAFDNQKILGHIHNASAPKGKEKKKTYLISRENVLLFLLETANFSPDDFIERLTEILKNRSVPQLLKIQQAIDRLLKKQTIKRY